MSENTGIVTSNAKNYAIIGGMAILTLAIHLVYNPYFGYHQDEFYFIACGEHLDFGYVDHAPMVPWIAWLSQRVFGESLVGLRFLPAVAGAVSVFLIGLLARRLGGGRFAQFLACLSFLIAPVYLRSENMLCIPAFEPMYWLLGAYFLVRVIQDDNPKFWLGVGVAAGLGLLNKHSMLFFGFGLAVAIVATPLRKYLKSSWLYAGGAMAALVFSPNIIWQMAHGWPTVEFLRELNKDAMADISRIQFIAGQILYVHPFNAPIWIAGLVSVMFGTNRKFRALGIVYIAVLTVMLITHAKIYYLSPAYPMLLAAGAVAVERFANRSVGRVDARPVPWVKPVTIGALITGGLLFAPLSLPMLDIERTDRYINAITFGKLGNVHELTGDLHAQYGWEQIVKQTAEAYETLTPEEKAQCIIVAPNYGVAGAIDLFGGKYGLPKASAGHMSYYIWGYPKDRGEVILAPLWSPKSLEKVFDEIRIVSTFNEPYVNKWMNDGRIFGIYKKPKMPLDKLWTRLRDFT
jgi:hypothetical protein